MLSDRNFDITPLKKLEFLKGKDYYLMELPKELQISVGEEPQWAQNNGDCIRLKNRIFQTFMAKNGQYHLIYHNDIVNTELQRTLGWMKTVTGWRNWQIKTRTAE